jgi:hypothetical protein
MKTDTRKFSIRATIQMPYEDVKADTIVASLRAIAKDMVFSRRGGTQMNATASVLVTNTVRKHFKEENQDAVDIIEKAQKLVVKGEGARNRIGPEVQKVSSTQDDVSQGLALVAGEQIDDPEGKGLRIGTLNYEIWEKSAYRKKLYFRIYKDEPGYKGAPDLPDFSLEDPFSVNEIALNDRLYKMEERHQFDQWFVGKLSSSDEELEATVFDVAKENVELHNWVRKYEILEDQAEQYIQNLNEVEQVLKDLEEKEAVIKVLSDQISELETT